ncbi:MAG TPA: Ig-like domain-containing protein, partial [Roseiflexaceae bacterium]|nr:Ig-like domain-containing protein [Roseiflexaceae bacterium]
MQHIRPLLRPRNLIAAAAALIVIVTGAIIGPAALSDPQIIRTTPADGTGDVNPQAPILIEFNRPINAEILPSAISFDPPVAFEVAVNGTLAEIQPQGGLQYGAAYRLTISSALASDMGRRLPQPLTISFRTTPYVAITGFSPAATAE